MSTIEAPRAGGRRTQAERVEASDRALVGAAVRLIAERGWQRTTLAAIGDASGYSRGLVSQRFGSKDGLLRVVLDRLLSSWTLRTAGPRVAGRIGVDAMRAAVEAYVHTVRSNPDSIRAYHALLREPEARDRVVALNRQERDAVAGWLRAGQRQGVVRADLDPRAVAVAFLATIRGTTTQWLLDPKVDIAAALSAYADTLERTYGAGP